MTNPPIRGILFDKDGTLFDFHATWSPTFHQAATEIAALAGRPERTDDLLRHGGQDPDTGKVTPGSLIGEATMVELLDAYVGILPELRAVGATLDAGDPMGGLHTWYADRCQTLVAGRLVPVAGLQEVLESLRTAGYRLGIATNDTMSNTDRSLGAAGILDKFDYLGCSDSGHGAKPDPGMIHAFFDRTGLAASEVMMVGDSATDLKTGRAAGVGLTVGVLTGVARTTDLAPHADHVVDDIGGVPDLVGL